MPTRREGLREGWITEMQKSIASPWSFCNIELHYILAFIIKSRIFNLCKPEFWEGGWSYITSLFLYLSLARPSSPLFLSLCLTVCLSLSLRLSLSLSYTQTHTHTHTPAHKQSRKSPVFETLI